MRPGEQEGRPPRGINSAEKRRDSQEWLSNTSARFALLFGGGGFGCGVGVLLGEALDAAGSVNQLLLAREEGMTVRAYFHAKHIALDSRASLEGVAAGAVHRNRVIIGMNTGFHEAPFCRVRSARHLDKVGGLQPRR